jgi:molecular chaperone GrpE (heat shock protein)
MDGEDASVSEQFFRSIAKCQSLFIEREREINSGQAVIEARLKAKESECEDLADELNGKNCEIHELKREVEKWKDVASTKSAEVEQLKARLEQPSTTNDNVPPRFTGFPDDLSAVR